MRNLRKKKLKQTLFEFNFDLLKEMKLKEIKLKKEIIKKKKQRFL